MPFRPLLEIWGSCSLGCEFIPVWLIDQLGCDVMMMMMDTDI
jgi:hypothetical protein